MARRAPGLPSLRLACVTHARCPAPCTRARACRARSTRTHHACTPRQPCTCSHAATRAHVKSLAAVLESLATGRPSAGPPLAHLARTRAVNTLAISAACDSHASPTCCACHPPPPLHNTVRQRHDDNDRDEDERHDEEDREHDGRSKRVRVRSRLPLSRAKAHAHARCQAPLTLSAKQEPFQHPMAMNDHPFDARHVATVGGPNRAIGRPSTTRVMTCSCS